MPSTDVAILGAGQAGLAASRCLSVLGIEHAVIERGEVAERWKTTTWDSLRMLTPNWMNGLPWLPYDGPEPNGFMGRNELSECCRATHCAIEFPCLAEQTWFQSSRGSATIASSRRLAPGTPVRSLLRRAIAIFPLFPTRTAIFRRKS